MYFIGAKLALFIGDDLLVIKRDNRPDIPFPDCWDLPGGGREGVESPEECALRETLEEVGLRLHKRQLTWSSRAMRLDGPAWFFAAHRPASDVSRIRFGNEGQEWRLAPISWYLTQEKVVPLQRKLLIHYLNQR